jgi:hypothetical protein
MPAVKRHQRHDDAKADEVNEDGQKNDEQRRLAVHSHFNSSAEFYGFPRPIQNLKRKTFPARRRQQKTAGEMI